MTAPAASIDRAISPEAGGFAQKDLPSRPARGQGQPAETGLVLTSVSTWTHRLILDGELTYRTANALEVEIERLCEEGVTDITLDLRRLAHVDPVGVAVVAFRCSLCTKRGYGFALIRGSREIQRTFEQAGVDSLPFRDDELDDGQLAAGTLEPAGGLAAPDATVRSGPAGGR